MVQTIKNIYCIGRNYVEHVHELGNVVPDEPVVFSKPTHAVVEANGGIVHMPKGRGEIHYETELVLKIGTDYRPGITVDEMVAEMTIGLDLTLRDEQSKLKERAHPWLLSKGFQGSAVLGEFISFPGERACKETNFTLSINDTQVQKGHIDKMIFPLQLIIDFIGGNLGLKKDDIIFTGTPEGVGALQQDDVLVMKWGELVLGRLQVGF